jgi:D-amino-acid dehydrogenase
MFDADELRQLEPTLSRDYVKGVLIAENGHTTNPHRLVNSLAQSFLRNGGRIERARAVGFDLDGGRLKGIRTDGGVVAADGAVVAAGVWSKALAAGARRRPAARDRARLPPHDPRPRGGAARLPGRRRRRQVVATPMELGIRVAGTVELAGLKAPPNWERARVLLRHVHRMFPALRESYPEGAHLDLDGPPPEPARLAAGDRPVAALA